ncbi:MAG: DUF1559 domain-containing protein [Phycisphaeraceae bacterium]|nr:DUF1559 domain-containing protein [Phycisphaeraceae bacterium]
MHARRGFTLLELLFGLATSSAFAGGLLIAMQSARNAARETVCMSNLKQLSMAAMTYTVDWNDHLPTYNWTTERGLSGFPDLEQQRKRGGVEALAAQAVDIIRRHSHQAIAPISGWLPSPQASPLILTEYLAMRLPEPVAICPSDEARQQWLRDPRGFTQSSTLLPHDADSPVGARWPYTSSYELTASAYDFHQTSLGKPELWPARLAQGHDHATFLVPARAEFRPRRMSDIAFPAKKAAWYDEHDRHQRGPIAGPPRFFADPKASPNTALFDGHVTQIEIARANPGWHPWQSNTRAVATIHYAPQPWERGGAPIDAPLDVAGVFRWTRSGLRGVDVDGEEIDDESRVEADLPHQPPAREFAR